MVRVARHFVSWPDMISQILLVAMVINVVAYVPSTLADATDLNAREFAVVLPFGAVLAGRTLAPALLAGLRQRRRAVAAALLAGALLAGYGASLGYAAAQPSVPPANARLAAFLAAHHLTSGIGGYWESSVVTVGSDGAVTIRAVLPGTLQPDLWEAKGSWYDSGPNRATFLVTDSASGFFNHWQPSPAALAALGRPARTYHVGPYTVYVWNKNLLAGLRAPVTSRARSALLTSIALALAVLFTLYLRQSRSVVVGSDGGSIALQGWDILHGNLLLHGWAMSDVSFYPTELPQYAMLEWLRGLSPDVVHLGGAMTYTIVLLLAALVASGRACRAGSGGPGPDRGRDHALPGGRPGHEHPAADPRPPRQRGSRPARLASGGQVPAPRLRTSRRRRAARLGRARRPAGRDHRRGAAGPGVRDPIRPAGALA